MKLIKKMVKAVSALVLMSFIVLKAPDLHEQYIIHKIASRTVKITNAIGKSGGTGFHIQAPSGEVYILTNAHVCELGKKTNSVFISQDNFSSKVERRIIEQSKYTDLCLVEGYLVIPGYHYHGSNLLSRRTGGCWTS